MADTRRKPPIRHRSSASVPVKRLTCRLARESFANSNKVGQCPTTYQRVDPQGHDAIVPETELGVSPLPTFYYVNVLSHATNIDIKFDPAMAELADPDTIAQSAMPKAHVFYYATLRMIRNSC